MTYSRSRKFSQKQNSSALPSRMQTFPILSRWPSAIKETAIYLHSSQKGKKIDILKKNSRVCFEADVETEVMTSDDPCKYNVRYRSVIGYGQAKFLEDYNEKVEGLTVLSEHYGKKGLFEFEEWKVNRLCVIKIEIEMMTGKENGF